MKLVTQNLSKTYRKRTVVKEVSLKIDSGQIVGLLGPNGAGKTTTFYMIVGLIKPDSGDVFLGDHSLKQKLLYERARLGLGYLSQEPSVFKKLTVEENLLLVLENTKLNREEKKAKVNSILTELGIEHLVKHHALTLSGGERRRLEIARSLVLEPKFLLLDEPYAGIDPLAVEEIQTILKRLKEKGIGILITDHNVRETLSSCDWAYLIKEGQIWIEGGPKEIVENEAAKRFYLGENFRL